MTSGAALKHRLIEASACVMVVIDMQDSFLTKYEKAKSRSVVNNAAWLIRVAHQLDIPIVAMAEDTADTGSLNISIAQALPEGTHVFDKLIFGCADQPDICNAIKATGRSTAVLIGMETDVCVAHSALGLMANGFDVAVVREAVISTAADEDIGLMRIRDAGGVICSVKSLYFEWLRSVPRWKEFLARVPEVEGSMLPPTITL
jgi:nicotinamidase-related amidase